MWQRLRRAQPWIRSRRGCLVDRGSTALVCEDRYLPRANDFQRPQTDRSRGIENRCVGRCISALQPKKYDCLMHDRKKESELPGLHHVKCSRVAFVDDHPPNQPFLGSDCCSSAFRLVREESKAIKRELNCQI